VTDIQSTVTRGYSLLFGEWNLQFNFRHDDSLHAWRPRLARCSGHRPLISRSQAKRVLARVDLFRTVVFDFSQIDSIGQAFADEIFRVFAQSHPETKLQFIHANASVGTMITRARARR
jgi:hypothetical protein